eukprot:gb/GECG01009032.1/.p1 GENE.gb/GECG01009032.1/~~gb/GECG01009032.1/.p1  ORF type:complete len:3284 (+),score=370.19 gb/GECG01009032.1/:1-9852(+)
MSSKTSTKSDPSAAAAAAATESKKTEEPKLLSKDALNKSDKGGKYAEVIGRPGITEGYVRKANGQVTEYNWKYLVHYGSRLLYYYDSWQKAEAGIPKNFINLDGAVVRVGKDQVERAQTIRKFTLKDEAPAPNLNVFSIETDRTYKFACETPQEMNQWGRVLLEAANPSTSKNPQKSRADDREDYKGGMYVTPKVKPPSPEKVKDGTSSTKPESVNVDWDKEAMSTEQPLYVTTKLNCITNVASLLLGKERIEQAYLGEPLGLSPQDIIETMLKVQVKLEDTSDKTNVSATEMIEFSEEVLGPLKQLLALDIPSLSRKQYQQDDDAISSPGVDEEDTDSNPEDSSRTRRALSEGHEADSSSDDDVATAKRRKQSLLEEVVDYTLDEDRCFDSLPLSAEHPLSLADQRLSITTKLSGKNAVRFRVTNFTLDRVPYCSEEEETQRLHPESSLNLKIPLVRIREPQEEYAKCPMLHIELKLSKHGQRKTSAKRQKSDQDGKHEILGRAAGLGSHPLLEPVDVVPFYRNCPLRVFKDYDLKFMADALGLRVQASRSPEDNFYANIFKTLLGRSFHFGTPTGLYALKNETPLGRLNESCKLLVLGNESDASDTSSENARAVRYNMPKSDEGETSGADPQYSFSVLHHGSVALSPICSLPAFVDDSHQHLLSSMGKAVSSSSVTNDEEDDPHETHFLHSSWDKAAMLSQSSTYTMRGGAYRITVGINHVQDVCLPVRRSTTYEDVIQVGNSGSLVYCKSLFVRVTVLGKGVSGGSEKRLYSRLSPSTICRPHLEGQEKKSEPEPAGSPSPMKNYQWSFQGALNFDLGSLTEEELKGCSLKIELCAPRKSEVLVSQKTRLTREEEFTLGEFIAPLPTIYYQIAKQGGTGLKWTRWIGFGTPPREKDVMNLFWEERDFKYLCTAHAMHFCRGFGAMSVSFDPISWESERDYGLAAHKAVLDRISLGPHFSSWAQITESTAAEERPLASVPRPIPIRFQPEGLSRSQVVFPFQMKPELYALNVNIHKALQLPAMDSTFFSKKKHGIDAYIKASIGGSVGYTDVVTRKQDSGIDIDFNQCLRLPVWLPLPSFATRRNVVEPFEREAAAAVAKAQQEPPAKEGALPGLPMGNDIPEDAHLNPVFRPLSRAAKGTGKFVRKGFEAVGSAVSQAVGIPNLLAETTEETASKSPLTNFFGTIDAAEQITRRAEEFQKKKVKMFTKDQAPTRKEVDAASKSLPSPEKLRVMRSREVDWWTDEIVENSLREPALGLYNEAIDSALHEVGFAWGAGEVRSPSTISLSLWDDNKAYDPEHFGTVNVSLNDIISAQLERRRRYADRATNGGTINLTKEQESELRTIGVGPMVLPVYGGSLWHSMFARNHQSQNVDPRLASEFHGYVVVSFRLDNWSDVVEDSQIEELTADDSYTTPVRPMEFLNDEDVLAAVDPVEKAMLDCSVVHSPKLDLGKLTSPSSQFYPLIQTMLAPGSPPSLRARISSSSVPSIGEGQLGTCFKKYTVAAMIYCVSNPPTLRSNVPSRGFLPSKMSVTLSIGGRRCTTPRVREERGQIYFNQILCTECILPEIGDSCPDIFLYITDRDGRRASYARLNVADIVSHTRKWKWGAPPFWATLYGDSDAFASYQTDKTVGSICLWLGMDVSDNSINTLLSKRQLILQAYNALSAMPSSTVIPQKVLENKHELMKFAGVADFELSSSLPAIAAKTRVSQRLLWEEKLEVSLSKAVIERKVTSNSAKGGISAARDLIGGAQLFQVRLFVFTGRHIPPTATLRPHNLYITAQLGQFHKTSNASKKLTWDETIRLDHEFAWFPKAPKKSYIEYLSKFEPRLDSDCRNFIRAVAGKDLVDTSSADSETVYKNVMEIFGSVLIEHELAPEIVLEVWESRSAKADLKLASTRLSLRDGKYLDTATMLKQETERSGDDPDRVIVETKQGIRSINLDVSSSIPNPFWVQLNPYFGGDWGLTDARPWRPVEIMDFFGHRIGDASRSALGQLWYRYAAQLTDNFALMFGPQYHRGLFMGFAVGQSAPCIPELLLGMQVIPRQTVDARELGEDFGPNIKPERKPVGLSPAPSLLPPTRKVRVHVAVPYLYGLRKPVGNQNTFDATDPIIELAICGAYEQSEHNNQGDLKDVGQTSQKNAWSIATSQLHASNPGSVVSMSECPQTMLSTGELGSSGLMELAKKVVSKLLGSGKRKGDAPGPVFPFETAIEGSTFNTQMSVREFLVERLEESALGDSTLPEVSNEELRSVCSKATEIALWEYSSRRYFARRATFDIELPDIAKLAWETYTRRASSSDDAESDSSDDEGSRKSILDELSEEDSRGIQQQAETVLPRIQFRVRDDAHAGGLGASVVKSPEISPIPPSYAYMGYHCQGFVGECSSPLPTHELWWSLSDKFNENHLNKDLVAYKKGKIRWTQLNSAAIEASNSRDDRMASSYKDTSIAQKHLPQFMWYRLAVHVPLEDVIEEDDPLFKDYSLFIPSTEKREEGMFQFNPEKYETAGKIKAAIAIEDFSEGEIASRKRYAKISSNASKILTRRIGTNKPSQRDQHIPRVLSLCTNPQRVVVRVYVVTATVSTSVFRRQFDPHSEVAELCQKNKLMTDRHVRCPNVNSRSYAICRGHLCNSNSETIPIPWISRKVLYYQRHQQSRPSCLTDFGCKEQNPIGEITDQYDGVVDFLQCLEFETTLPGVPLLNLEIWRNNRISGEDDEKLQFVGGTGIDLESRWLNPSWHKFIEYRKSSRVDGKGAYGNVQPRLGPVPIETRPLWTTKTDPTLGRRVPVRTGKLQLWVDLLDSKESATFQQWQIQPPRKSQMELRVVVWRVRRLKLKRRSEDAPVREQNSDGEQHSQDPDPDSGWTSEDLALPPLGPPLLRDQRAAAAIAAVLGISRKFHLPRVNGDSLSPEISRKLDDRTSLGWDNVMDTLDTSFIPLHLPKNLSNPKKQDTKKLLQRYKREPGYTNYYMRALVVDPVEDFYRSHCGTTTSNDPERDKSLFRSEIFPEERCISHSQATLKPGVIGPQVVHPDRDAEADRMFTATQQRENASKNENKLLNTKKDLKKRNKRFGRPYVESEHTIFNWRFVLPVEYQRASRRPPPKALRVEFCRSCSRKTHERTRVKRTRDEEAEEPIGYDDFDCIGSAELDIAELIEQTASQQQPAKKELNLHGKFPPSYVDRFSHLVSETMADRLQGNKQEAFWVPLRQHAIPAMQYINGQENNRGEESEDERLEALVSVELVPQEVAEAQPAGFGRAHPNVDPMLPNPHRLRMNAIQELSIGQGTTCCGQM